MWPENVDSDCAIDCSSPMSANTSRKMGRRLPGAAGMCSPAWCMSASRPSVRRVTVLPPVFGPVTTSARVPVAQPDVDRDDPTRQAGMARREQGHLRRARGLGARGAHLAGELGLGRPQVEPGKGAERLAQRPRVGPDERRQLVQDALDLLLLGDLGLAPCVAELHDHERLDEQGLPAARGVVDDALDATLRVCADGHDVAPVAKRDERLLERAAELRRHERIQPAPQAVEGDPNRRP